MITPTRRLCSPASTSLSTGPHPSCWLTATTRPSSMPGAPASSPRTSPGTSSPPRACPSERPHAFAAADPEAPGGGRLPPHPVLGGGDRPHHLRPPPLRLEPG